MKKDGMTVPTDDAGPSPILLALVTSTMVFVAYAVTLAVARDLTFTRAVLAGVANTVPIVLFGAISYRLIRSFLVERPVRVQAVGHAVLAVAFIVATYWLLIVLLGAITGTSAVQFNVQPFPTKASAWQVLQNATFYVIVATLAYVRPAASGVSIVIDSDTVSTGEQNAITRYFIRSGDDIQPIDVDMIISIKGADDYAEVRTAEASHLVRMTLSEFERSLDAGKFIRVHRSRIVNVDRITRAEPAGGGRMLIHMENGEGIATSRSGATRLRNRLL